MVTWPTNIDLVYAIVHSILDGDYVILDEYPEHIQAQVEEILDEYVAQTEIAETDEWLKRSF